MKDKLRHNITDLALTALDLVAPGKGILAADESEGTIEKRFNTIGVESTAENRRAYRQLLFTTPNVEEAISGVILFDETIHQAADNGRPFPQLLQDRGIIPGIKVDKGKIDLPGFDGEKVTEGLDGLNGRLAHYRELGARFAKWRAVYTIDDYLPTHTCIQVNAHALARYAALCQANGLVPIVEPEVLMNGDHGLDRCEVVTGAVLQAVFAELLAQGVAYEGMLLKPNMVLPGQDSPEQVTAEEVAAATLRCFRRVVPAAVPGIVFLSGGQGPEEATERLNAMNAQGSQPWELSFSFGRALQEPVLQAWQGQAENVSQAQQRFLQRAMCNRAARRGDYGSEMEEAWPLVG
ncbi:MAG: fructose-bisphosphate aldolase class I [Ardenticatenaceae bacterium]|nr:fructose-bisphosphate aldolase class I [Ardenticatenaceae bacterium]MCB8988328.1 fructose-bisphosphate aldolase class I [Ardenticatenaceae bacterium]